MNSCLAARISSNAENGLAAVGGIGGLAAAFGSGPAAPVIIALAAVLSPAGFLVYKRIADANRNGRGVIISAPWIVLLNPILAIYAWGVMSQ